MTGCVWIDQYPDETVLTINATGQPIGKYTGFQVIRDEWGKALNGSIRVLHEVVVDK